MDDFLGVGETKNDEHVQYNYTTYKKNFVKHLVGSM